jgi:NADPH:quinone reductase-like Zn-dependent oxidoreductase
LWFPDLHARFHQGFFTNDKATFQEYTTVPAEIVAKIPENVTFDEAASIPLGLATAAVGFYDTTPGKGGAALTPPWEAAGAGKYKGQGTLILGGSSSVGQYGASAVLVGYGSHASYGAYYPQPSNSRASLVSPPS